MKTQTHNSHVRPNNDQDDVAGSKDLVDILTAEIGQTRPAHSSKVQFWDAQVIAERCYIDGRSNRQEIEYLVEALPIWRRHGGRNGVNETHLKVWEELSSDKSQVVEADIDHFEITMHRRHPIFDQRTAAEEIFMRGLQCRGDDPDDEVKAVEMLGHMITRCSQEQLEDQNTLTELAVTVCNGMEESEDEDYDRVLTHGQNFLEQVTLEERNQFAASLLADENAMTLNACTIAFCIAILSEEEFLDQWREYTVPCLRENAQRTK